MQITELHYASSQYPEMLRNISAPPRKLYLKGNLRLDLPLVAIVGTRKPTSYGRQVTYRLASELAAAGVGIVSGMALGIDAIAHTAALEAGGYTIAVMGCGLDELYPARNRGLGLQILKADGAIISEFEVGEPPLPFHFPQRNRIIAGLCAGAIVTEADIKSGSLITADFSLSSGRHVMAVPGNITSLRSAGPNQLIKHGATPITDTGDVLELLNLPLVHLRPPEPSNKAEATILELLQDGVATSQALIEQGRFNTAEFGRTISLMEITGKVRNLGAGVWAKRS